MVKRPGLIDSRSSPSLVLVCFPERYNTACGKLQSERSNDTIDSQEIAKYINYLSIFFLS